MSETYFKGGGCLYDATEFRTPLLAPTDGFPPPKHLDYRGYCLPASNQGASSACCGFALAGMIEVMNWRRHDAYKQIDGLAIYKEAKRIDGWAGAGTFPRFTIQAAQNLGLLSNAYTPRRISTKRELLFAMHSHLYDGVVLAAFNINEAWNHVNDITGEIPPDDGYKDLGGHLVLGNTFDDAGFGLDNSWGLEYGDNGWVKLPWERGFDNSFLFAVVLEKQEVDDEVVLPISGGGDVGSVGLRVEPQPCGVL